MVNTYKNIFNLHENVSHFFLKAMQNRSLSHAYLMCGRQGLAKFDYAKEFAKIILTKNFNELENLTALEAQEGQDALLVDSNSHPNLVILEKDEKKKNITVEQVRELSNFLNKTSYNANKYKVVIINSVDNMSSNASNALLKSLEEPNPFTLFFIICHNVSAVLPTISSRCIKQQFNNLTKEQMLGFISSLNLNVEHIENLDTIIKMSEGSLFLLKKCVEDKDFYSLLNFILYVLDNIKTVRAYEFIEKITALKTLSSVDFVVILDVIQSRITEQNLSFEYVNELINLYKKEGVVFNASFKDMLINLLINFKLSSVL